MVLNLFCSSVTFQNTQKPEQPFCQSFDLTKLIPHSVIESASKTLIDASTWDDEYKNPYNKLLSVIRKVVNKNFRLISQIIYLSLLFFEDYSNIFIPFLITGQSLNRSFVSNQGIQGVEQRNILRIGIQSIASPSWQSSSPQVYIFFF